MTAHASNLRGCRTIRALAQRAGLTLRALRYYEELGLISVIRDRSGNRRYPPETCRRVMAIALLRRAGVSLPDVCAILDAENEAGEAAQQALALEKLTAQLTALCNYVVQVTDVMDIVRRGELGRVTLAPEGSEPVALGRQRAL